MPQTTFDLETATIFVISRNTSMHVLFPFIILYFNIKGFDKSSGHIPVNIHS